MAIYCQQFHRRRIGMSKEWTGRCHVCTWGAAPGRLLGIRACRLIACCVLSCSGVGSAFAVAPTTEQNASRQVAFYATNLLRDPNMLGDQMLQLALKLDPENPHYGPKIRLDL